MIKINGFLNINKPDGMTSQQVVSKIKHKLGVKKVGHMGTLDPAGAGVLPIAIGKATKLFDSMQDKTKIYRAIFRFGIETDTLDAEGVVTKRSEVIPSLESIQKETSKFIGVIEQLPPKYSAKCINGKRAYELARQNIDFELKTKSVEVIEFEVINQVDNNSYLFEIECTSGTYIRSLCRDLAYALNSVAYMPLIIRIKTGKFDIKDSVSLTEFLESQYPAIYVKPMLDYIDYPILALDENEYFKVSNGVIIDYLSKNGKYCLTYHNELFSIGNINDNRLKMEIYLND